ncbi:amidohydrolase family protein [Lewinella cohaerens]|uniref:amidohydrolase family protein n=1 Tax=Lewinella cohaerens TaxID=70995 RepID=UPI00037F01ED|nr:amidohydrolase family protein [Lewinella cohaerens]
MQLKHIFLLFATLLSSLLMAQPPVPGAVQAKPIAIVGGTAHLGNGEVIENALVTFDQGKITRVDRASAKVDLSDHEVVDGTGKHIYPGLIAPNTQLGIVEIAAVSATRDNAETGYLNPNARSLVAYNTDSQVTPTVRSRGVLFAQVTPQGGALSGQSSIVQLDAWNWEDAAVLADDGHHLNWPRRRSYSWRQGTWTKNERYAEQVQSVEDFLRQAQAYCAGADREPNLRLASACGLFNGKQRLFVHANLAKDIEQAILLGKKFDLDLVIVGGEESYLVTELLREYKVPVVLGPTHALPGTLDSDVDQPFKTPAALHEAGVQFCLSNEGFWQQRNLPFQAGTAVAYGLPYEKAIQALTLDAASILGVADRIGSLEVGKDASLIITSGDVLDMRTSVVEHAFIDGRKVDLDNKQDQLYRRFQTKYQRQK